TQQPEKLATPVRPEEQGQPVTIQGADRVSKDGRGWRAQQTATRIPTIELDLHTTPGEEARNPTLRRLYGATTEQLQAESEPWTNWRNPEFTANGEFGAAHRLSIEACMDNRVV